MANPQLYMQIGKTAYDTSFAMGSTIGQYSVNRKMARMQAETLRSQARLAFLAADRQSAYINEEAAQNVWNVGDRARLMASTQYAAMGASGFDISTGDNRIVSDTFNRANAMAAGINRTAYLQDFENQMQARLEAARLEYAARSQELIAKQNAPFKALIASQFAGLGAFAGNIGGLAAAGAFGKTTGGQNISPNMGSNQFSNSTAPGYEDSLNGRSVMGPKMPWGY